MASDHSARVQAHLRHAAQLVDQAHDELTLLSNDPPLWHEVTSRFKLAPATEAASHLRQAATYLSHLAHAMTEPAPRGDLEGYTRECLQKPKGEKP
jgi:hypothetical protein